MFKRTYHHKYYLIGLVSFFLIFFYTPLLFAVGNVVKISWSPPTTNINGSPLTDINGYRVYYGNSSRNYTRIINVGNNMTYDVNDLAEGLTYYFAVTAYDTSGNESLYSNEVFKIIPSLNIPPIANPGGIYSIAEGQATILNGSGSSDLDGSIVRYEWDINSDGIYDYSSVSATSSHIFGRQGVYIVKLRVIDNLGAAGEAVTMAYISDTSPAAVFTGNPTGSTAPLTVNFSNTSSGFDMPFTYAWDFDNNGTIDSTLKDPSFTYTNHGSFTVKLSVSDSDGSISTFTKTDYITVNSSHALDCPDGGNIMCLQRTDGGSDSDNLDNGKPRADVNYEFLIKVKDTSGRAPQYVNLYMAQRHAPLPDDFYSYTMSCDKNISSGGLCTYVTKLGPAAVHKFYFKAQFFDGAILRYPETGYITGPEVQLLRGFNLAGIPRNIGNDVLGGYNAFGSTLSYRWDEGGYYTEISNEKPVKPGEGYYIDKQANTLPELAEYGEIQDTETVIELKPGWNIISNPYSGNVELSRAKIRKGNNKPVSWTRANANRWTANAISYRSGADWGDYFILEGAPQAKLVPWRGYWIFLYMTDDTYYILIPKPEKI
jgi:PKD repeat protein